MLNLYASFVVPGVDHVTMYHDDQDPHLFYMLPELPRVVRTSDNTPMFSLIAFARDLSLMKDKGVDLPLGETEGGLVNLTLCLEVTEEDQKRIVDFIKGQSIPQLRFRPFFMNGARILMQPLTLTQPIKLSYPNWVDGAVAVDIIPGDSPTFLKGRSGSEKPSLINRNLASYEFLLGQEGVRLVTSSLKKNWCPGTVRYDISFVARIPTITIKISGNSSDVYNEIKQHCTVTEYYNGNGKVSLYRYPAVSSLDEMRSVSASLHIDVSNDDFRPDAAGSSLAQDVQKTLNAMALTVAQDYITNKFCAAGFEPGLKADKLGTDPLAHDPNRPAGVNPLPANQLWLKDFTQSMTGSFDFTITSRANLTVTKHPNATLYDLVNPGEVERSIITADLNTPIFFVLDVPVTVNADYERDPIAAIKVFLDYDEVDDISGDHKTKTEEFLFDTAKETFRFRTTLARNRDGTPKDTYRYRSQIIYKNSQPSEMTPETRTRERTLVISYDRLSCVNVIAVWGAIPADTVERAVVSFRYPGLQSPSAQKEVILSPQKAEDNWFTYTGGGPSREYEYHTSFFLADGQRLDMPAQKSVQDRLVLDAPFQDKLQATFVPQGMFPPISSIVVSTRYSDPAHGFEASDVHTFTSATDLWKWEVRLVDRGKREFEYKVDVSHKDSTAIQGEWKKGAEGTNFVGEVANDMLNVDVVTAMLDMQSVWRMVLVRLHHGDASTDGLIKIMNPADASAEHRWTVPLRNGDSRKFTWQAQAFGVDPSKNKTFGPFETEDPLVVLQF